MGLELSALRTTRQSGQPPSIIIRLVSALQHIKKVHVSVAGKGDKMQRYHMFYQAKVLASCSGLQGQRLMRRAVCHPEHLVGSEGDFADSFVDKALAQVLDVAMRSNVVDIVDFRIPHLAHP